MKLDMKFEVAIVPVSDVDRAKAFYTKLGWRVDDDIVNGNDFRAVQLTPPNSAASVTFGKGVTDAKPVAG
jgi:catechol 2,3-dioxygenase-like lactoylglutathione lyase family enzyme